MKIYHTQTQADYDALMVELEAQECKWSFGRKLSEVNNWHMSEHLTCLRVYDSEVNHASLNYYKEEYPHIPIEKYKAKADEKMKFTKANVMLLLKSHGGVALDEAIKNLDDKPKKVGVPKFIGDALDYDKHPYYEVEEFMDIKHILSAAYMTLSEGNQILSWVQNNPDKYIMAVKYGYTIEQEKLYYIPLPSLETSDGLQQVLSKRKNDTHYFASRPNDKLKQRYTKDELERVPEVYKPYAKLIEEEAND